MYRLFEWKFKLVFINVIYQLHIKLTKYLSGSNVDCAITFRIMKPYFLFNNKSLIVSLFKQSK